MEKEVISRSTIQLIDLTQGEKLVVRFSSSAIQHAFVVRVKALQLRAKLVGDSQGIDIDPLLEEYENRGVATVLATISRSHQEVYREAFSELPQEEQDRVLSLLRSLSSGVVAQGLGWSAPLPQF